MFYKKAKPLKDPSSVEHGYGYALFLLELRFRSEQEMQEKMKTRGYKEQVIADVISRLKKEKLIDDERLAESLIHSFTEYRYYGYLMVKKKLIEKLLPKQIIEGALSEWYEVAEETKVAKTFVKKQYGELSELKKLPYADKQKIFRRLAGKGFRLEALNFLK